MKQSYRERRSEPLSPRQAYRYLEQAQRLKTTGPAKRSQTGIHGEASAQPDSARPDVRGGKRIVHQRGGQPSLARAAAARARAWVSRNQFGDELCSWNIDSIVCCQTSSLTCISCWFPIDTSQSERKVRNMRIPPPE